MSKRNIDPEVYATPSKRVSTRRQSTATKRTAEEAVEVPASTNATRKRTRKAGVAESEPATPVSTVPASTTTSRRRSLVVDTIAEEDNDAPARRGSTRRNTERLTALLEQKNILPSPVATKQSPFASSSPAPAKSPVTAALRTPTRSTVSAATTSSSRSSLAATAAATAVEVPPGPPAPPANERAISENARKQLLRETARELQGFWGQCRDALNFSVATVYPVFLTILIVAYMAFVLTHNRAVAAFAVVFSILSGLILGFFFLAVVPFVILARTLDFFLAEQGLFDALRTHPLAINLATRVTLLLTVAAALGALQYFYL